MNRVSISGVLALFIGVTGLIAQEKQPTPKSQAEVDAIQAMFKAQDPDSRIKAAEDLMTKFADTEFKAIALQMEAASYQQKNDFEKMVIYGERALQANPKDYMSMLMLATGIAQRTREHDLDREEKLAKAEKYANSAKEVLKDSAKPNPQITDEQWDAAKKDFMAQAHEALGMSAMARKKYDVAVTEFRTAADTASTPDPATMVRLGAALNQTGKHDEAIAVLDKVMAKTDVHPSIKQFAQAEKVRATQAKSGGSKPATAAPGTPAPVTPQVEIKKP